MRSGRLPLGSIIGHEVNQGNNWASRASVVGQLQFDLSFTEYRCRPLNVSRSPDTWKVFTWCFAPACFNPNSCRRFMLELLIISLVSGAFSLLSILNNPCVGLSLRSNANLTAGSAPLDWCRKRWTEFNSHFWPDNYIKAEHSTTTFDVRKATTQLWVCIAASHALNIVMNIVSLLHFRNTPQH